MTGPAFTKPPRFNHIAVSVERDLLDEDHVGVSVSTLADFDEVARRAAAWRDRLPGEVELIDPAQEDFAGVLRLHSFYVRYRLPIMVEVQHFEFLASP